MANPLPSPPGSPSPSPLPAPPPRRKRPAWTLILVPPRPGKRMRQVSVSTRALSITGFAALTILFAATTWMGENKIQMMNATDLLVQARAKVSDLRDSMHMFNDLALKLQKVPPHDMILPVDAPVSSPFSSARLHPILGFWRAHEGVDLSAPAGTRIAAAAAGRVVSVGWHFAYGLMIEIEHTGDVTTRYAHCRTTFVHLGDQVSAGDIIGTVGSTGLTTGPHVHFEVRVHGDAIDPLRYVARSRVPLNLDSLAATTTAVGPTTSH